MFGKEKKPKRFVIKEEQSLGFGAVYVTACSITSIRSFIDLLSSEVLRPSSSLNACCLLLEV